jgi:hypothetical protein
MEICLEGKAKKRDAILINLSVLVLFIRPSPQDKDFPHEVSFFKQTQGRGIAIFVVEKAKKSASAPAYTPGQRAAVFRGFEEGSVPRMHL